MDTDNLTTYELRQLRAPDARICPKCKGMRWLYRRKAYVPEWDVDVVPCDRCNVNMDEPEPQPQRERSWRR